MGLLNRGNISVVKEVDSMDVCSKCGTETTRTLTVFDDKGHPLAIYCLVCKPSPTVKRATSLFENFRLDHVKDERGQNVVVNSLKELREAEKRYNFALACMSDSDGTASEPPQHKIGAGDLSRNYEKKFNRDPAAYSQSEIDKAKSNVGTVMSRDETLVDRPNPMR
jgi:hypothetical protein